MTDLWNEDYDNQKTQKCFVAPLILTIKTNLISGTPRSSLTAFLTG
jgi:hypothetical protein